MTRQSDLEALRSAAEARLKHRCMLAEVKAEDATRLLHELQVHQIELEMQNSELQTTRNQLEAALAGYTELYDFAPVGYFTLDRRGIIRKLNLAGARLLNTNRAALKGSSFSDFVETQYQTVFADALHQAASSEIQASCELALAPQSTAPPTSFVHIEITPSDSEANLLVVVVNITAARLAQDALKQHLETFNAIMSATPDLVYYVDSQFTIRYINRVPAGLSMDAVIGTDVTSYVAPEYRAMVQHTLSVVFETGRTGRFEILARREDERPVWYDTWVAPIFNDSKVVYAALLARDITERVESAQRLKAISQRLLGAQESARRQLSNELHGRTSANLAALGINLKVTEMALAAQDWQQVSVTMADIHALVQDTEASIREICAELRPPSLDYAGLAPAVEAYASLFFQRTGIAVNLDCATATMKLAPNLESTLFRIVQEALTNVAKHAEARSVQIQLHRLGSRLHLNINDDGRGFDISSASSHGLGIITMREMAEFSSAEFKLNSSPGNGTQIQVELNLDESQLCTT